MTFFLSFKSRETWRYFPTKMLPLHSDFVYFSHFRPNRFTSRPGLRASTANWPAPWLRLPVAVAAATGRPGEKPSVCTADELHRVAVAGSYWSIALWRYRPSPKAERRNRPLLLLSGIGTNAFSLDVAPGYSFPRYFSNQGFDTWILELRGAGCSTLVGESREDKEPFKTLPDQVVETNGVLRKEVPPAAIVSGALAENNFLAVKGNSVVAESHDSQSVSKPSENSVHLFQKGFEFLNEGQIRNTPAKLFYNILMSMLSYMKPPIVEISNFQVYLKLSGKNFSVADQIRYLSGRGMNSIEEGQWLISSQLYELQESFSTIVDDFQKQLDLILKYNWDFDDHLKEDVPAAMEYVRSVCKPKDGKLHGIGHSMGGMLLYAMLSQCGFEGRDSGLASVSTLASSLDFTSSKSWLKLLLPLADTTQALNIPVLPFGKLLAAAHPLMSQPPYLLSWLTLLVSAQKIHPELLEKLVLNSFGAVLSSKLLLQLAAVFQEGGLRDRNGTFLYKHHLRKSNVPVLAVAGDRDIICPSEAVYETIKVIPRNLITYKVFGEPDGPHYGHYDLVGGPLAAYRVHPCLSKFLIHHDMT